MKNWNTCSVRRKCAGIVCSEILEEYGNRNCFGARPRLYSSKLANRFPTEMVGPNKIMSFTRSKEFETVIDENKRYILLWFIHTKCGVEAWVIVILKEIGNLIVSKNLQAVSMSRNLVKWLRVESNGKFVNGKTKGFLKRRVRGHGLLLYTLRRWMLYQRDWKDLNCQETEGFYSYNDNQ